MLTWKITKNFFYIFVDFNACYSYFSPTLFIIKFTHNFDCFSCSPLSNDRIMLHRNLIATFFLDDLFDLLGKGDIIGKVKSLELKLMFIYCL